jgi:hypothetical protein
MDTLQGVRHLTRKGEYTFSFDLHDGFYALGINLADRDYFTVNVRGLKTSGANHGLVPLPFQFLEDGADFRKLPAQSGPRKPYRAETQMHEDPPQTNALARRPDSTLRRHFLIVASTKEEALT